MKNCPLKLLIIGPQLFFMYWPGCPNSPETEILYHQKPLNAELGTYLEWDEIMICNLLSSILTLCTVKSFRKRITCFSRRLVCKT